MGDSRRSHDCHHPISAAETGTAVYGAPTERVAAIFTAVPSAIVRTTPHPTAVPRATMGNVMITVKIVAIGTTAAPMAATNLRSDSPVTVQAHTWVALRGPSR